MLIVRQNHYDFTLLNEQSLILKKAVADISSLVLNTFKGSKKVSPTFKVYKFLK